MTDLEGQHPGTGPSVPVLTVLTVLAALALVGFLGGTGWVIAAGCALGYLAARRGGG